MKTDPLTFVLMVTKKWLGTNDLPSHILSPQIDELMNLDKEQLIQLRKINPDTASNEISKETRLHITVINRLIKRRNICQSIAKAQQENLYEISEYLSGSEIV